MLKVLLKAAYMPLAILAVTAAGSIYSFINNLSYLKRSVVMDVDTVEWFSFAVNASFLTGILPAILTDKVGARQTMLIGGLMISGAHILSALMFAGSGNGSVMMLFIIGIVGGQGASMIFLSAWSAMVKYHSILCTNLISAILFSCFLGSDTFHLALKQGLFPEMDFNQWAWTLAIAGLVIYLTAAIVFTMKNKAAEEEKSFAKGMILKTGISMYAVVQGLYMALSFLLLITFQQGTQYGSGLLLLVLSLNFLVPFLIIASMTDKKSINFAAMTPNETDKFLMSKGKNVSATKALQQPQFWYLMFTCAVTIGIARMMDENANLIAVMNSDMTLRTKRTFQTFEVVGAFLTGAFLSVFRINASPQALTIVNSFLLVASQILMFFISYSGAALMLANVLVGFLSGSTFTIMGVIAHEEYGIGNISRILAMLMTASAVGILVFEEFVFDWMYAFFATQNDRAYMKDYGKWNKQIFLITLVSSGFALLFSIFNFRLTKGKDGNKDKVSELMNLA